MSDASSLPATTPQSSEPVSTETDYRQIIDALMQTQRGRRFLAEHARRCRQTQQADLLAALVRLERAIAIDREPPPGVAKLRSDLGALAQAVESVRTEVAALRPAAPPHRLRPQDEEILQLLREQSTRLDALAEIWTRAEKPAPHAPVNAPQPAVETGDSNGDSGSDAKELREEAAVPAQNGFADGPAGEPYRTETPASDLLRQTPIFDLAFGSRTAATEPAAGAIAASEEIAEAAEHPWPGEPAASLAIVRDTIEHAREEPGSSLDRHPEDKDGLPDPTASLAIVRDTIEHASEELGSSLDRHPEDKDDLPDPAASLAIVRDTIEQAGEEPGESLDYCPATSEPVRLTESDRLKTTEAACNSAETAFAPDGHLSDPEPQLPAREVAAADTPAAGIMADPPSATLTAESPSGSVADEAPSASVVACDSPAAVAAAGDPLAPLYALSEEERIALFT